MASVTITASEIQKRIMKGIAKKGATLPCRPCGRTNLMAVNGYFSMTPAGNIEMSKLGDPIPIVAMRCQNCGYLSLHDLDVLEKSQ